MSHDTHGEQGNSAIKIIINMIVACLLSGVVIAGAFSFTEPVAIKQRALIKKQAMEVMIEGVEEFRPVAGKEEWYEAIKGGKMVAYIVPAQNKGYEGIISMVAAIEPDGKVVNFRITSHRETPGLGDKALELKYINQYIGKYPDNLVVVKHPTDENIQALTGATITSRAVTNGIKRASLEVIEYHKQKGGE